MTTELWSWAQDCTFKDYMSDNRQNFQTSLHCTQLRINYNKCSLMVLRDHTHTGSLSGLVVTCLTAVWQDQGLNLTAGTWHGLHTYTAVPRSTQPSTTQSAFKLNNINKRWWWMWMIPEYSQPKWIKLVWQLEATCYSVCINSLVQWLSNIND